MPYCLSARFRSPAAVHQSACASARINLAWIRAEYGGGIWRRDHFRICSFCGSIHPEDLLALLRAGGSRLEASGKPGKHILLTPNPIAGELCRMGSLPGAVFPRDGRPRSLRDRLRAPAAPGLEFAPSLGERLAGHFEKPCLEPAPAMLSQPFYSEHVHEPQLAEILAAASEGAQANDPPLSSA